MVDSASESCTSLLEWELFLWQIIKTFRIRKKSIESVGTIIAIKTELSSSVWGRSSTWFCILFNNTPFLVVVVIDSNIMCHGIKKWNTLTSLFFLLIFVDKLDTFVYLDRGLQPGYLKQGQSRYSFQWMHWNYCFVRVKVKCKKCFYVSLWTVFL